MNRLRHLISAFAAIAFLGSGPIQASTPDDTLDALLPFQESLQGIAVESTFNWYWLVDGLQEQGYNLQLVNTAAVKQYDGLKYSGDSHDAFHLAHLMRLGILPTGYIYPKEQRAIRDLLRRRLFLVRTARNWMQPVWSQIRVIAGPRQLEACVSGRHFSLEVLSTAKLLCLPVQHPELDLQLA